MPRRLLMAIGKQLYRHADRSQDANAGPPLTHPAQLPIAAESAGNAGKVKKERNLDQQAEASRKLILANTFYEAP